MLYNILFDDSLKTLIDKVQNDIGCGWVPCGGVAVTYEGKDDEGKIINFYFQAMTCR